MKSLAAWLATRSQEQLAALIAQRSPVFYGRDPRTLDELTDRLVSLPSVNAGLISLTTPGHQLLTAAAKLATEIAGASAAPMNIWSSQFGYRVSSNGGTVAVDDLLVAIGGGRPGAIRDAALEVLHELQRLVLMWPHGDGMLAVAGPVLDHFAQRQGEARTIDRNLTSSFNKGPVGIIAETLGVGMATAPRNILQAEIVAHLSDAANVRKLFESAPGQAQKHLEFLLADGALMATKVFPRESNYSGAKYTIALSYVDTDTLWLARRGLILPAGPDRAEVPVEVVQALRDGAAFPFTAEPAALPHVKVTLAQVSGEAQTAIAAAAAKMSKLLEALDQQPVAPRKTGGLPVRETRRLAKLMGLDETETRFWIGLANHAGLIDLAPDRDWYVLCPTDHYDRWLDSAAPERLALILRTWLSLGDVITWWPFADETPIAFGEATDPYAPRLRSAVLNALASLPPGGGCLHATPAINPNRPLPAEVETQLDAVTNAAVWFAPFGVGGAQQPAQQVLHTVYEAELLGVAAHGALTEVGRALLAADEPSLLAALVALLPAERVTARFQADMTVIVTGTPSAALATLLGSVADRESEGHAVVYRISAATVRRALDAGAEAADLLGQLAEVAEGTLPQPLAYMIKEVGRTHGKMRVVKSACCIRCDDDSLIAELVKAKGLAKLGLRRIAPTVLISVKPPSETLAALRSAGYSPTLEAETGTTVIERTRGTRSSARPAQQAIAATPQNALKLAQRLLQGATPGR